MFLHRDIHSSSILRAFFDPTPRYMRETPCYRFYATSLMKKRNRFHVCQKPSFSVTDRAVERLYHLIQPVSTSTWRVHIRHLMLRRRGECPPFRRSPLSGGNTHQCLCIRQGRKNISSSRVWRLAHRQATEPRVPATEWLRDAQGHDRPSGRQQRAWSQSPGVRHCPDCA
jgi:hypothetical protein